MDLIKDSNLALRFLLELVALGALGYWGYQTGSGPVNKIALAIGAPLVAATIWGLFVAPKATFAVPGGVHLLLQVVVFGVAVVALIRTGHDVPATALGAVAVANAALMAVWNQ